jgi:YggT family protein
MAPLFGRAVETVPLARDFAARVREMRGAARRAVDRLADAASEIDVARAPAPRGASLTVSRSFDPLRHGNFAAMIPGDSAVETVITSGLFSTLNIYNTLLIGRLILTWFPNPPRQLAYPLATLCDPYLNLFRGIIPPIGGTIDLSPILAFTVLNVFTNTAAALPCEIGPDGEPAARTRDAGRETARRWASRMKQAAARRVEEAKK